MPTLTDWSWICLMLMQAMLGNVSANVRMITLGYEDGRWQLVFYLEHDNVQDREDAADTVEEFGINLENVRDRVSSPAYARIDHDVIVTRDELDFPQGASTRIIFSRREESRDNSGDTNSGDTMPN